MGWTIWTGAEAPGLDSSCIDDDDELVVATEFETVFLIWQMVLEMFASEESQKFGTEREQEEEILFTPFPQMNWHYGVK